MLKVTLLIGITATYCGIAQAAPLNIHSSSDIRVSLSQYNINTTLNDSLGNVIDSDKNEKANSIGFSVRHHFNNHIAADMGFSIADEAVTFESDTSSINTTAMTSLVLKADKHGRFTPYIKAGYAIFDTTFSYNGSTIEDRFGTYVTGIGLDCDINESFIIGIQYEYFGEFYINYSDSSDEQSVSLSNISLNIGIRI